MQSRFRMRLVVIALSVLLGAWMLAPTVISSPPDWLAGAIPEEGAKLGLDLQGGMYLVLDVKVDEAVTNRVRTMRNEVAQWIDENGYDGTTEMGDDQFTVTLSNTAREALGTWLEDWLDTVEVADSGRSGGQATVTLALTGDEERRVRNWAVLQNVETIRNRIDQYGVSEPSIQRQGTDRIVVQLPGVENPQRVIELIGETAQLTFHPLREDVQIEDLQATVEELIANDPSLKNDVEALNRAVAMTIPTMPPDVAVRFQRVSDEFGSFTVPVLVSREPVMTGDTVVDARVRIDPQFNEPYVSLEFNPEGGERFEEVTGEYVGKRVAIVLDETVYSAPVIRERIAGGRASIEGGFTVDEARDLAIVLRAGALAAPATIEEERTVGPSLGEDSINRGMNAITIGGVLVLIFMLVYYRYGGFVANVSLIANLVYLLGILSAFGATLTLPGLAGIVLTIGMAVDGNVIIFERIREELRQGKSARAAVDNGFAKAMWTVLDANITTMIAGLILFQFGTGPVRGFAVTLTVGIVTTLFSVLFVSRTLMEMYVHRRGVRQLPI